MILNDAACFCMVDCENHIDIERLTIGTCILSLDLCISEINTVTYIKILLRKLIKKCVAN